MKSISVSFIPAKKHSFCEKKRKKEKTPSKFVIDCSGPVNDAIFDLSAYEKYLHDRIKVGGRTNNLSGSVTIAKGTNSSLNITVSPGVPFPKRYIKYLTKKFLKKNQLRDWLRVIATSKSTYQLKYFNIAGEDAGEEDEE